MSDLIVYDTTKYSVFDILEYIEKLGGKMEFIEPMTIDK